MCLNDSLEKVLDIWTSITFDLIDLTTVDYSGGIIITDWYYDTTSSSDESIKISVRFLSNDIRSDSLKIIVHKKKCSNIRWYDLINRS